MEIGTTNAGACRAQLDREIDRAVVICSLTARAAPARSSTGGPELAAVGRVQTRRGPNGAKIISPIR